MRALNVIILTETFINDSKLYLLYNIYYNITFNIEFFFVYSSFTITSYGIMLNMFLIDYCTTVLHYLYSLLTNALVHLISWRICH